MPQSGHIQTSTRDFDTGVAFLTQYIDKRAPTPSVTVACVAQNRPAKWQKTNSSHGTIRRNIKIKKYSREQYDSMSMAQHQELYKLWKKAILLKGKKTPESSNALENRVAMLEAKTGNVSNESLFPGKQIKASKETIQPLTKRK